MVTIVVCTALLLLLVAVITAAALQRQAARQPVRVRRDEPPVARPDDESPGCGA